MGGANLSAKDYLGNSAVSVVSVEMNRDNSGIFNFIILITG